jgi:hypothetical protein
VPHRDAPNLDPRIADSQAALRSVRMIALRETLEGIPWTHRVDHSFQAERNVGSAGSARLSYRGALNRAPVCYTPIRAWCIPEPHPTNPGHWHIHGLWQVPAAQLWRGWWSDCKEWWGANAGWARIWPLPHGDKAALGKAVTYAAKHHVKAHPLTWTRYATRYERDSNGGYTMSYWSRGGKRMVLDAEARQGREVPRGLRAGARG